MDRLDKIRGCLYGTAFGDALGAPTEFIDPGTIVTRWPPHGPTELQGQPARVTDDTQMALAVAHALINAPRPLTPYTLEPHLREQLVAWERHPQNNRAPGRTCLLACAKLGEGLPWLRATVPGSKGCGANMRVMAAAFIPDDLIAPVAQLQSAMTHGHPTALAASDLTAVAIRRLADGTPPGQLLALLTAYAEDNRSRYYGDWLDSLWQRPGEQSAESFIARGWEEMAAALARVKTGLSRCGPYDDPCEYAGDGWIAEEALATALLCFLLQPDAPREVLRQAATTRGDSDSLAAIAGALAGAYAGTGCWPDEWYLQIEYGEQLDYVSTGLASATV